MLLFRAFAAIGRKIRAAAWLVEALSSIGSNGRTLRNRAQILGTFSGALASILQSDDQL
jgi:hypothetical protein